MIAVVFEAWPAPGEKQRYLDLAAALKSDLEQIAGFISIERFQSMIDPDKLLSLSFFKDEDAVKHWRNRAGHRATQAKGRSGVFSDYRLRIAEVSRDYGLNDRAEAPRDSLEAHREEHAAQSSFR
jgi:heme-degrading monooxygenase HmoA